MLGYNTPAEVIGITRISDAHTPEDFKYVMEVCIPAALKNGSWSGENRLLRPDGSILPVDQTIVAIKDKNGRPSSMGSIMTDLTERKRTEQELQESRTLIESVVENAPFMIFVKEAADLRFIIFNHAGEELVGRSRKDLLGKNDFDFFPPEQAKWFTAKDREVLEKDGIYDIPEEPILTAKKGQRILHTKKISIKGPDKTTKYLLGISEDITERKLAEEKITELNEDLKLTVSKMETANKELETFTYSVSHDLRTPLRHITAFAKLLDKEAGDQLKGETRHYLEVISASAVKMDELITSLLAFSKLARTRLKVHIFSGRELAEEAAADIKGEHRDREIEWRIGEIPQLNGDRFMLKQVFINLLDNAVKYSRGKNPARIEIFSHSTGDETIIGVRDNGTGFNMKLYDRLFGVFQRLHTDQEFEGTGIGLANVKSVISKHGGRVWAESMPDKETTFYFSLPASDHEVKQAG